MLDTVTKEGRCAVFLLLCHRPVSQTGRSKYLPLSSRTLLCSLPCCHILSSLPSISHHMCHFLLHRSREAYTPISLCLSPPSAPIKCTYTHRSHVGGRCSLDQVKDDPPTWFHHLLPPEMIALHFPDLLSLVSNCLFNISTWGANTLSPT